MNAADSKFNALNAQMQGAINTYAKPVVAMGLKADRQPNVVLAYCRDAMPFDPDWTDQIGHIAYDLRTALDQLMTQLYIATNNQRPPKRVGKKKGARETLQFPICTSRRAFDGEIGKGRMQGLDNRFGHLIWHYQPMRMKTKRRLHALTILESLSNVDKHRHPNIAGWAYEKITIRAVPLRGSCVVHKVEIAPGAERLIKKRTHVARIHLIPTGIGQPGVGVYLDGPAHPAFANGLWVSQVFSALIKEIRGVIGDAQALIGGQPPAHLVASAKAKTRGRATPPWPAP